MKRFLGALALLGVLAALGTLADEFGEEPGCAVETETLEAPPANCNKPTSCATCL